MSGLGKREKSRGRFSRNASRPSLASSVPYARRVASPDAEAVVDEVEAKLQHLDGRRALGHDFLGPTEGRFFELGVRHHRVDHAHLVADRTHIAGALLAHLTGEVRDTSKLATSASVCLNTACSLLAIVMSQTTCKLWPPPTAHPGTTAMTTLFIADLALDVEDVETVDAVFALVTGVGADVLVRCKKPNLRPWETAPHL